MAVTTRVSNPHKSRVHRRANGPHLLIVNGGRKMAKAAKKRRTSTRRVHHKRAAPKKRVSNRTHNARRYNAHHRHHAKKRTTNRRKNTARRYNRRRHNPGLGISGITGLLGDALTAVLGAGITSYAYSLVGPMLPIGGIFGQVGIKLGLAWLLGEGARKFGMQKYAHMLAVGGAVSAGQDAFSYFIGGGGAFFPAPAPALKAGQVVVSDQSTGSTDGGTYVNQMGELVFAPPGTMNGLGELIVVPNYYPGMFS